MPSKEPGSVAAAANGRTFAIAATEIRGHHTIDTRVLMLQVSADDRTDRLTLTPLRLTSPSARDFVNGIALSPDGTKLAAAVQIAVQIRHMRSGHQYAEIKAGSGY